MDNVALEGEAEADEDIAHRGLVYIGAEQGVYLLRFELDVGVRQGLGDNVDYPVDDLARAEQFYKLAGALYGVIGVVDVQTLLVAGGSVGAHAEGGSGAADGGAVEVRALKEHHRRVADDLAVLAAHDARDRDGLLSVADAEHGGGQRAGGTVERADALALAGKADMDFMILDAAEVEGVHRLAVFHHDVVRDIDDVVYRAHTGVADALAHPCGGRSDLDVLDHARSVARAELRFLDDDLCHVVYIAAGSCIDNGGVQLEGLFERDGGLTRKTDHAQAVRAVRGDLVINDVIIQPEQDGDIVTGPAVLVEDEDAVGDAVGELLLLCAQVVKRADVVFRRVVSNQIARMQVHAPGLGADSLRPGAERERVSGVANGLNMLDMSGDDLAEYPVTGLDVGGDGGLFRIDGVIVAEDSSGSDDSVGEVMRCHAKLLERAEHAVGGNAAQLALGDLHAAGQQGVVQRDGDDIALMDVPCAGAYLDRLALADVYLGDEHMVGIGVLLDGDDAPDLHAVHGLAEIVRDLDLGAGDRHGLAECMVVIFFKAEIDELVQPFS